MPIKMSVCPDFLIFYLKKHQERNSCIGMAMVTVMTGHDRDRYRSVKGPDRPFDRPTA